MARYDLSLSFCPLSFLLVKLRRFSLLVSTRLFLVGRWRKEERVGFTNRLTTTPTSFYGRCLMWHVRARKIINPQTTHILHEGQEIARRREKNILLRPLRWFGCRLESFSSTGRRNRRRYPHPQWGQPLLRHPLQYRSWQLCSGRHHRCCKLGSWDSREDSWDRPTRPGEALFGSTLPNQI